MGYRLENRQINLTGKKSLSMIASGNSGDVYRLKKCAVKIYKDDVNVPFDESTARYLSTIQTERILLPKNLVFYDDAVRGYSMKLVTKGGSRRIITTPRDKVVNGIRRVENDAEKLSNKKVLLNKVTPENSVFNGNLYLCNPSGYSILEISSAKDLERINKFQIHLLLIELISQDLRKSNYGEGIIRRVREMLCIKDTEQESSDFLDEVMGGQDTIKQMVKKII